MRAADLTGAKGAHVERYDFPPGSEGLHMAPGVSALRRPGSRPLRGPESRPHGERREEDRQPDFRGRKPTHSREQLAKIQGCSGARQSASRQSSRTAV
jgi:hypothetical protein